MPDEFSWLSNATFGGKFTKDGKTFDQWENTIGYAYLLLIVEESNPNAPVFLHRKTPEFGNYLVTQCSNCLSEIRLEFAEFHSKKPNPEWFEVPHACLHAQDVSIQYSNDSS